VVAATRSLFTGKLDGQNFMPQRTGGCCYISTYTCCIPSSMSCG
jgi:hypothetical protein